MYAYRLFIETRTFERELYLHHYVQSPVCVISLTKVYFGITVNDVSSLQALDLVCVVVTL